jgi:hypothetical protein
MLRNNAEKRPNPVSCDESPSPAGNIIPSIPVSPPNATRRMLVMGGLAGMLGLLTKGCVSVNKPTATTPAAQAIDLASIPRGAVAQLIAGNLSSALRDVGYPADWFLANLLALGLQGKPPKLYRHISGGKTLADFAEDHFDVIANSYTFLVSYYNKEVEGYHMFLWHGVRMNGLQIVAALDESVTSEEAWHAWRQAYFYYGEKSKPVLTYAPGHHGWSAWEAALQLIATPEAKAIWLTSADAPNFPSDNLSNEVGVQLVLGHPAYDSGRKPLAYFSAVAVALYVDSAPMALQSAIQQALSDTGLNAKDIGSIVHDSGRGMGKGKLNEEARKRQGVINGTMQMLFPNINPLTNVIDLSSTFGDLGASTVNLSLLIGAFACHERKHPVLYMSVRDPGMARALVILPSPEYSETDMARRWRPVNQRSFWSRSWWGQRRDGKPDY